MPTDFTLPPGIVTAHAASLRALARSLALDEHAADDVVQETWVRALTSPPARGEGIAGWLRRVAAGFALQRHRSEGRRTDRERKYARERPEAVTGTDARAETLRAVVEAVLSLEDPYRETVLLRWFEGLPPRDIAARQSTTVATVNSRLQRAHGLLRERLSRRLGIDDRRLQGVLLAIFGADKAGAATAAASISLVGFTLTTTKMISAAGIAAVALCAVLYCSGPDVRTDPPPVAASPASVDLERAGPIAAVPGIDDKRVELGAVAAATPAPAVAAVEAGPYEFDVTVIPIDGFDRPLASVEVRIGLEMRSLATLGTTAWNGELHATWRSFEPSVDLVLDARRPGLETSPLRRVHLVAGRPETITLAVDISSGNALMAGRFVRGKAFEVRLDASADVRNNEFTRDEAGNGVFVDPWLLGAVRSEKRVDATELALRVDSIRMTGSFSAVVENTVLDLKPPPGSHVTVLIRDENGRPLPKSLVTVMAETDAFRSNLMTTEEGKTEMDVPSGRAIVMVGGNGRTPHREELVLEKGERRQLEFQCAPLPRTRVRLLDSEQNPLAGWHFETRQTDDNETFIGRGDTDADGRVALFLPSGLPSRLYVRPFVNGNPPKLRVETHFFDPGAETDIVLREHDKPGQITCVMTSRDPMPASQCEVRLWNTESREGTRLVLVDQSRGTDGTGTRAVFRAQGLVPGEYTIEFGAPGVAWDKAGPFFLEPGQALDAGVHELDLPAHVDLTSSDAVQHARLTVATRVHGLTIRSSPIDTQTPAKMVLTSGKWTLHCGQTPETEGHMQPVTLPIRAAPGEDVRVVLPADSNGH